MFLLCSEQVDEVLDPQQAAAEAIEETFLETETLGRVDVTSGGAVDAQLEVGGLTPQALELVDQVTTVDGFEDVGARRDEPEVRR
jgi:hypothetical protein